MVIKSNTHTTVVQREERAVVYLCSFEAKTQTDRKKIKKKTKKNQLIFQSLYCLFLRSVTYTTHHLFGT